MVFFTLLIKFQPKYLLLEGPAFFFALSWKLKYFSLSVIVYFIQGGLYLMNYRNLPATSSLELINNIDIISVPHIASHTSCHKSDQRVESTL